MKSFICISLLLLSGCSVFPEKKELDNDTVLVESEVPPEPLQPDLYYQSELINDVNNYAKWLMQDLISNLDLPSNEDVFLVADMALLDSDLNKTNHFGRQFTEALIHEVNRAGFSVIDVKNRGFIRFNEEGDVFYQTRDFQEVSPKLDVSNILTGTMTRHRGGYLINAKVIDANNNALITSGQILVPHQVVDAVMKENVIPTPEKTSLKLKAHKIKG